jgi:hypothetical protein
MAGPITWKNVTPVDTSGEVNAYLRAGQQLGQGIAGIGEATNQFVDDRVQAQTDMMTAELLSAGDDINAANQIIQKYSQGNFAPTSASIQKAQDELRAVSEYNDQMRTNFLDRLNTQDQMRSRADADRLAREKFGLEQNEFQLNKDKFAEDQLNNEQTRKVQQQQIAASQSDVETEKQDRQVTGYELTDLKRQEDNRAYVTTILDQYNNAKTDQERESIMEGFREKAPGMMLSPELKNQLAGVRQNYLMGKAQQLNTALPSKWTNADGNFQVPEAGASNKEILAWETQAKEALRKIMPTSSSDELDKAFETWAASSDYGLWRQNQRLTNEDAIKVREENRSFELKVDKTNVTNAMFDAIASTEANKQTMSQLGDEQVTMLKGQIQELVQKVDTRFPNITKSQKLELLRRMATNIKFDDAGWDEFHWITGDNSYLVMESGIHEMSGDEIFGAAKYIFGGTDKWQPYAESQIKPAPQAEPENMSVMP